MRSTANLVCLLSIISVSTSAAQSRFFLPARLVPPASRRRLRDRTANIAWSARSPLGTSDCAASASRCVALGFRLKRRLLGAFHRTQLACVLPL